jgi:hypothetical protein
MSSDRALRREIERLVDVAAPPAPWLEQRVITAVRARAEAGRRAGPRSQHDFGALRRFGSGLWLGAGLVALLIAVGTAATLLMSGRLLHDLTVLVGNSPTVQTSSPSPISTFTPSPAVRASNWPPGGPIPAQLAGGWQQNPSAQILHLGGYTFELGDVQPGPNICGHCAAGNVVVNRTEIDFIDDACTLKADFGFERFTYTLTGNTLVLTRAQGPGQSACQWLLAGTYSRVSTP